MKVLIDTNIILDSLLEREPFVEDADALFEAIEKEQIEGYVTATTLTNIFYIFISYPVDYPDSCWGGFTNNICP